MPQPELTQKIAYQALQDFFNNNKPFVLFGSGLSCAVASAFSMNDLRNFLKADQTLQNLTSSQKKEWDEVLEQLKDGQSDFETAMNAIKDKALLETIINATARCVGAADRRFSSIILENPETWPAVSLFRRLTESLPETDPILHVATTNYDLLAEYAFSSADILYTTGYEGGVLKKRDWEMAKNRFSHYETIRPGKSKLMSKHSIKKHICLYKVHGSLNLFKTEKDMLAEYNAWTWLDDHPAKWRRVMITPGIAKHETINKYRASLFSKFDEAVARHSAFLFLGFGFNDNHLANSDLMAKLKNEGRPALIITKCANDAIHSLIRECKNIWLVCEDNNNSKNSVIKNGAYINELSLEDEQLWKADVFFRKILGG